MQNEIECLRRENKILKGYKDKYDELIDSSLSYSNEMMGNLLKATLHMDK